MLKIIQLYNKKFIAINTEAIQTIIPTTDMECSITMLDGKVLSVNLSFEELMAYLTNTDISHIEADKAAAERINIEHQKTIDNINEHLKVTEYEGLSIDDLDLSVRAYNILKRTGIAEVRDLAKMTFEEIDNIEKFTPKLTMEVINKLRKFGIEIK